MSCSETEHIRIISSYLSLTKSVCCREEDLSTVETLFYVANRRKSCSYIGLSSTFKISAAHASRKLNHLYDEGYLKIVDLEKVRTEKKTIRVKKFELSVEGKNFISTAIKDLKHYDTN